jgi:hypothetical protein
VADFVSKSTNVESFNQQWKSSKLLVLYDQLFVDTK